ncbi:MAG TPA: lipid-A-disaccharide synthase [Stellaceae bacterium]|nr:lipid-A-disaccharide synthase [Stellaceae bacterium]
MSEGSGPAGPLIFLIAGEPSGDVLGARLMAALRERTHGAVRFAGVGGENMEAAGLESLVPISDLAVMGVAEVLPRARRIFRRVAETVAAVRRLQPDAVVTIDSSGFTWRVAQRLRRRGERLPLIHYVAPMVWAWRPGRARRMARWYDHLMTLLPFEPPYFEKVGLSTSYVGHPVVECGADAGDGAAFRRRHAIDPEATVIAVLPGSRRGEIDRLIPIFRGAIVRLKHRYADMHVVIPTVSTVFADVSAAVKDWPVPAIVLRGTEAKYDAFAASNAALAASGTVTLELALAGVPMVVAYRVNPATHAILRRLVKVRYANLINLILDRPAIPELLQKACTPERLATELARLLDDRRARERQLEAAEEGLARLGRGGVSPGLRAADRVLAIIAERARAA